MVDTNGEQDKSKTWLRPYLIDIKEAVIDILKEWKREDPLKICLRFFLIIFVLLIIAILGYLKVLSGEATAGLIGGMLGYLFATSGPRLVGKI